MTKHEPLNLNPFPMLKLTIEENVGIENIDPEVYGKLTRMLDTNLFIWNSLGELSTDE